MADAKISQLSPKASLGTTDLVPIVDNASSPGVTKQVAVSVFDARYIVMAVALG